MNKVRRKALADIIDLIEEVRERLEMVRDEEQEAFDNLPESFQCSERGEAMEEYIYTMEEVLEALDTDSLLDIVSA